MTKVFLLFLKAGQLGLLITFFMLSSAVLADEPTEQDFLEQELEALDGRLDETTDDNLEENKGDWNG